MIADLHAHYPMHLVPDADGGPFDLLASAHGRTRLRDRIRALIIGLAGRFANYRSLESGPRVTLPLLEKGGVGLVFSVLYSFFDELDLGEPYGAAPRPGYLETLIRQLDDVEAEILREHGDRAVVAHTPAELDRALDAKKIAFVHCVEGGFHLGATRTEVERGIEELARRGVVYVTLAHLLWRRWLPMHRPSRSSRTAFTDCCFLNRSKASPSSDGPLLRPWSRGACWSMSRT